MTIKIKWQEPPVVRPDSVLRFVPKWQPVVDALKMRPGVWAVIAENTGSVGLQTKLKRAFPGLNTRSHKLPSGKWDIYAVWMGR